MADVLTDTIGGRVRSVRKNLGITIAAYAEKLGITKNYLALVETGKRNPSPELLHRIAESGNVEYSWLSGILDDDSIESTYETSENEIDALFDSRLLRTVVFHAINYNGRTIEELASLFGISQLALKTFLLNPQVDLPIDSSFIPVLRGLYLSGETSAIYRDLDTFVTFFNSEQEKKNRLISLRYLSSELQEEGYIITDDRTISDGICFFEDDASTTLVVVFFTGRTLSFQLAERKIRILLSRAEIANRSNVKLILCGSLREVSIYRRVLGFEKDDVQTIVSSNLAGWSYVIKDISNRTE